MKICDNCGYESPPDMKFCGICGALLPSEKTCAFCGAPMQPNASFCGKCGAPVNGLRCAACGTDLPPDSVFCINCGAPVSGAAKTETFAQHRADAQRNNAQALSASAAQKPLASEKSGKRKLAAVKGKVVAFENKNGYLINGIIAVLAFVFIFVSLFAPIKMTTQDPTSSLNGEQLNSGYSESSVCEINQLVWQIIGSISNVNLNVNNDRDRQTIREVFEEQAVASNKIAVALKMWANEHPLASEAEAQEKFIELYEKYMSDINYLAYQFVFTTIGALDLYLGEEAEKEMEAALIAMRNTAVLALVTALIAAAVQIAVAVVSLIFLIFAIIRIVRKKQGSPFRFMFTSLLLSVAGLAAPFVAPLMSPGGALFAVALISALALFACGAVKAAATDKSVMFTVKRAVGAALAIVAFFMICANIISYTVIMKTETSSSTQVISCPLGAALENIFAVAELDSLYGNSITYSGASIASCVAVSVIGLIAYALLFAVMAKSLAALYNKTESGRGLICYRCSARLRSRRLP